ncbi:MAG: hypothetical protein HYS13_21145 [Planctomycetia bacterium]|nr:hypothetical protein [Planctomycetia bacterium]
MSPLWTIIQRSSRAQARRPSVVCAAKIGGDGFQVESGDKSPHSKE